MVIEDTVDLWKIKFFNDKYMMLVFKSLLKSPKTAQQIGKDCNISIATVYRKLNELEKRQLVRTSGSINNGVRNKIYKKNPKRLDKIEIDAI